MQIEGLYRYEVTLRLTRRDVRISRAIRAFAYDPDDACSEGMRMAKTLWPGFTIEIVCLLRLEGAA